MTKTVIVFLKFKTSAAGYWIDSMEHAEFGEDHPHKSAHEFLICIRDMHRKHGFPHEITNIIIG